ncbi:hypothetical protein [Arthrobacter sp. Cr_A7]|uniref:hypothetical protein n=1 Tax=Arthrobacter sp. Cr_A7 TaxID=3031017 RepID=UPI0023D98EBD|nr:hypothetical protein [Arthrobacter sp. Cr_A7]MDF2051150.1 hypothetical protein [Arthrobacter sp. Cr_A7]
MSVLEDVEHRAEHAQVWVAEAAENVVAAVTLTFAGQPYSEIATDGELEFRRAQQKHCRCPATPPRRPA